MEIAFRTSGDFVDQPGEFFDSHMFGISGMVLDMRTGGHIVTALEIFHGLVFKGKTLFEAAEGESLMFCVKAVWSSQ